MKLFFTLLVLYFPFCFVATQMAKMLTADIEVKKLKDERSFLLKRIKKLQAEIKSLETQLYAKAHEADYFKDSCERLEKKIAEQNIIMGYYISNPENKGVKEFNEWQAEKESEANNGKD